jgi:pentatricopeptide repeat protein
MADRGDLDGAERLLAQMQMDGTQLTCKMINSMIRLCANTGNAVVAEQWLDKIVKNGMAPNRTSYCGVVLAWAKAGDLSRVELWIGRMIRGGFTPPRGICRPVVRIIVGDVIHGTKAGDMVTASDTMAADQASAWLLQAQKLGVLLDRPTINLVMAIYARAGDIVKAEGWARVMQKSNIPANQSTLGALVTASKRAGNSERANLWLSRMEQLGFEQADLDTSTAYYSSSQTPPSPEDVWEDTAEEGSTGLEDGEEMAEEMMGEPAAGMHYYMSGSALDGGSFLPAPVPHRFGLAQHHEHQKHGLRTPPQKPLSAIIASYELPFDSHEQAPWRPAGPALTKVLLAL